MTATATPTPGPGGPPLHPDLEPVGFLLGTWAGQGAGEYPTIEPFTYIEEVTFGHVGKPFLAYSQKTRHKETGLPLHAEVGYLRAVDEPAEDRVGFELALVQPTGIIETHLVSVRDQSFTAALASASATPLASAAAQSVTDVERIVTVTDDSMHYRLAMAVVGHPLTHHLEATLTRQ